VLQRQLDLLLARRRWLWSALGQAARFVFDRNAPYHHEPDLVGRIGYRELNYGAVPDGKPLDPAVAFHDSATATTEFESEPYDLVAAMPTFTWPTVVISGGRDLITPPSVAERIASLIPGAVLVKLATAGHSAIDLRERAVLDIVKALYDGTSNGLPARAATLDSTPGGLGIRLLVWGIAAAAAIESALPAAVPRAVQRVTAS
jgi:proline iminopeptidase